MLVVMGDEYGGDRVPNSDSSSELSDALGVNMRLLLALLISLFLLSLVFLKPIFIHQGYQVEWKEEVVLESLSQVKKLGYKLLMNGTVKECSSSEIAYCLMIPGPNGFLKVERRVGG